MKHKTLKYFSTVIVCAFALCAGWWLWNYYMQSPWTRDGKVRAELVNITPEVSGRLEKINANDNQFVPAGSLIFTLDPVPYQIAFASAEAALAKAQSDLAKAEHEAARRRGLPRSVISAEDMDESNLAAQAMKAAYKAAQANLEQAKWNLSKTKIYAPTDGYITNLQARVGNYASAGTPLVALVDVHSFYVLGYFEETKLKHIKEGNKADIVLYNGNIPLQGQVESIGRAIYDQSVDSSGDLLMDVKPNVPWVRLAQRVPVRIKLLKVPADLPLVAGTTCTISIHQQG
ncbi:efflux RND transporter periplasmic adaptor subunit [Serratia entomophila]|uniref:efflux RND transporter periplasmic adaptor subunit n=1 Tax=Serratia entomophila TaxID=42906 RepID=UPI00217C3CC1|nr:HlyD family secretion protein [Serratia entomophila]CAI0847957.1 Inner membrane protein yibH [Serratia entomophila]CAI1531357.1 Inner membrane protein yibH [Serratia entomophila]CAI1566147.1 Inner membrane protein yibH [Serratia entomophila]CAI1696339.1 Inner membrane protein yibH [Serratia entomophila]CAI1716219.1 Inner membrane protein yibH [Serratia entomophila]